MNFLHPWFLYGLFALSIPIIVHLFDLRKAKKQYFTNTAFLQQVQQTNSGRRKLKHYLILVSRLSVFFFIVMAFAMPFIPAAQEGLQNSHVVIYLDNSQSMSNLTEQQIRGLDEGIAYVSELVELYPQGTQFLLLTNDFAPFSNTFKNGDQLIDPMSELSLSNAIRSFQEVSKRITSTAFANNVHDYEVYLVSDFQKSTLGELANNMSDSTILHYLLPISFTSIANLCIDSVYLDNPFDIQVNKSTVNVVLKNSGEQPVSEAVLKLYLNDRQISSKSIYLEANSTSEVSFDIVYKFERHNSAHFSVDDYPITFDNDFYFNLNARQPLKVVEIRGNTEVLAIENVYANTALFDFQHMSEGNIDYNQLHNADLIILHELTSLPAALANQLYQYKQSTGKLVIIPSASFNPQEYALLTGVPIEKLPLSENQPLRSLQKPDLDHPFYANIFEKKTTAFTMADVRNIISWKRLNSLLKVNNRTPFLSYHEDQGISYIFASSLSPRYTNLAQQAIFVPLMYKLAGYKSKNSTTLYQSLDQLNISVKPDSIVTNNIYKLQQGKQELIPSQFISGNELLLEIPKNKINAGFAQLIINKQVQQMIAFNHGRQESNPAQWSREELQTIANSDGQLELLNITEATSFATVMKDRYQGVHLWKYAIVLALLFLFIEILIIRFYRAFAAK